MCVALIYIQCEADGATTHKQSVHYQVYRWCKQYMLASLFA